MGRRIDACRQQRPGKNEKTEKKKRSLPRVRGEKEIKENPNNTDKTAAGLELVLVFEVSLLLKGGKKGKKRPSRKSATKCRKGGRPLRDRRPTKKPAVRSRERAGKLQNKKPTHTFRAKENKYGRGNDGGKRTTKRDGVC